MAKLVILSGVAGAGKSTFINNYFWGGPVVVLSTDQIRKTLTGDASCLEKDDMVWKYIYAILKNPPVEATFVVDATNLVLKRRKSYLQFKNKFTRVELWYLAVDVETALNRNAQRDRHVPEDVIRNMYKMAMDNMNIGELIEAGYDEVRIIANN